MTTISLCPLEEAGHDRKVKNTDLSIIIVSYNTLALLRTCLRSILDSECPLQYEVIVVDNASKDGSAEMVESEFPWVRLLRTRGNLGLSRAENLALPLARGRYILLLNPDTVVLNSALERMVEFLEIHPDVAVVGCRVLDGEGKIQASTYDHFPNLWRSLLATVNVTLTGGLLWVKIRDWLNRRGPRWLGVAEVSSYDYAYGTNRETRVITGCCYMIRRSVIQQVGLFDEHFFITGEEVDWCYRAGKMGFRLWFTSEAEIIHYGKQAVGGNPLHRFLYYPNVHYHLRKHFGRLPAFVYRLVLPPVLLVGILTHLVWLMVAERRAAEVRKNLQAFVMAFKWSVFCGTEAGPFQAI
jgi:hypothetical protein